MIGSEEVYRATMSYLDWRVYGFFFSFIAVMFRAFYVSTTNTKILTANFGGDGAYQRGLELYLDIR